MPNKRIEQVCQTTDINGNDKLLVVKSGSNVTRSVTVDNFIHENSINTGEICNCAITEPKIGDGAIKTRHMTANTIDGCVISTGTLDAGKITTGVLDASKVNVTNLDASCITSGTIGADRIGAIDISTCNLNADCITSGKICGDLIDGLTISADCITGLSITGDDITSGTLDACCVTISNLDASCITSGTIGADRIGAIDISTCNLNADCITSGTLDADRIGAIDISTCNLNANCITTGILDADRINACSITSDKIAACSVQTCHLAANSVDAGKIAANAVGVGAIAAGAVAADALESNIVIAGSIQSSNFDGFNYVCGTTTGEDILQHLNTGEQGFFLDERTGTAVFTDIIARDNVIAANYIRYSEDSGLSAIDDDGNFGINLDTDFLSVENGKVTITRIPSDTVVDSSLFTTPNTIFFGQSETQEFELPTITQDIDFFGPARGDTSTWSLCAVSFDPGPTFYQLAHLDPRVVYSSNLSRELYLFHEDDFRDVSIYNSEFVSDDVLPVDSTLSALDALGSWYDRSNNGLGCEHVLFVIDLHKYGITAGQVNGNVVLNNLKIKYDTSHFNMLSLIESFNFLTLRTYWSSTTAIHSDISTYGGDGAAINNKVLNPTLVADIYEKTIDLSLGHPKTGAENGGASQRFAIVTVHRTNNVDFVDHHTFTGYQGYIPLSAEFTTDTNIRFDVTGAVPETKNHDLSSINHLIPGQQLVRAIEDANTKNNILIPFEWSSDRPRQQGFPELNINSPLSGSAALSGGTPVRDILDEHGSWRSYSDSLGLPDI